MPVFSNSMVNRPKETTLKSCECKACRLTLRNSFNCPNCSIVMCKSCLASELRCPFCKSQSLPTIVAPLETCKYICTNCHNELPLNEFESHAEVCGLVKCENFSRCQSYSLDQFEGLHCSKGCRLLYRALPFIDQQNKMLEVIFK